MRRLLDAYLFGELVGTLIQEQHQELSFSYNERYVKEGKMPISVSLPLSEDRYTGYIVKAFFSGILPDNGVRYRLAKSLGVSQNNPFGLLEVVGGECAGALSFYKPGESPSLFESPKIVEVLDEEKLEEVLDLLKQKPLLAGSYDIRLSLAGAQDKIAVSMEGKRIALVGGGQPTTHILKTTIPIVEDSVYNEFFCMRLSDAVGIETPVVSIGWSKTAPYFLVERYDRKKQENGTISRLHQEDFCQALGILPELKYEREGGATISGCQSLLRKFSAKPASDQKEFLNRVIFNYLIGNADAHGKNFSLLYKGAYPILSPTYDLISTAVYPNLSKKMAMKIGGKYNPQDVYLRHWLKLVGDSELAKKALEAQIKDMANATLNAAIQLKKELRSEIITSPIFDKIISVIQSNVEKFK